ncbi:MAG: glycosyltransferase [Desulfovibrionaceae bacterium]
MPLPHLNICLVHGRPELAARWRDQGHAVRHLTPEGTIVDLGAELAAQGFRPDLVVQVERLGPRTLLRGLDALDCRKVFWSVDTHLNLHWHGYYSRLFDLTCTTQHGWVPRLGREGAPRAAWLPWFGERRPFRPHAARARDVGFVGRVSEHRPARAWLMAFLKERCGLAPVQGLGRAALLAYYDDTRLVPNESILGEVNFRLFEAASCGCAVLNPDSGEDPGELFEPGREVVLVRDVLELRWELDRLLADRAAAESLGLAAWERVRRSHLAEHRADRLLELAADLPAGAARGPAARAAFAMTLLAAWEGDMLPLHYPQVLELVHGLPDEPEAQALALRVLIFAGARREVEARLDALAAVLPREPGRVEDPRLAAAASLAALRLERWDLAKAFWYGHARAGGLPGPEKPEGPVALHRIWARELARAGRRRRGGFLFREGEHLPCTALECLVGALQLDPEDQETTRRLAAMTTGMAGAEPSRLAFLSDMALRAPRDWRRALELGLANLEVWRLREGLADLIQARDLARDAGEADRFQRLLTARDRRGLAAAALTAAGA